MFPREVDDERGVISLFNKEFHGMLERLDARMLRILETEDDLEKRTLIFEFPKQLRVLQANLDEFCLRYLRRTRLKSQPLFAVFSCLALYKKVFLLID